MASKKMTKTKMAALAALIGWPIAYMVGYRNGLMNIVAGGAVFMWVFQLINDAPVTEKPKRNLGFRQP
jgi:hypothetical protein